jgi:anti-sigma regulatory factor (Ser/Thr protein kinase)
MGVLMIHDDARDAFLGRWPQAAGRTLSADRDEIGQTATAAYPSPLAALQAPAAPEAAEAPETRTDRRWLALAAEMAGLTSASWRPAPEPASTGPFRLSRVATRTLGADAGSVRAGRDFAIATLHRWDSAERSQDIAIVVSELLTNALRHALPGSGDTRSRRPIQFGLLQLASCILCAVADPSSAAPAPRTQGSLAETGRGLHIICALSDQWGYVRSDPGKVVWAMFYLRLTGLPEVDAMRRHGRRRR